MTWKLPVGIAAMPGLPVCGMASLCSTCRRDIDAALPATKRSVRLSGTIIK
ncbi:hypothetical protein [Cupriavidus necator]|uniref:hypothetical protein n=1 Tax=Cupriavidus necator TaxID=106590 RepID=UPI00278BA7B6|nr:hypothetical protein [Cupriavidus necator]MDQ0141246.1 hypothetical protein [Cupriavidus necator]